MSEKDNGTKTKIWTKIYFPDGRYQRFADEIDNWEDGMRLAEMIADSGFNRTEEHCFFVIPAHAIERVIITRRTDEEGENG